jgi:hypothetical protein
MCCLRILTICKTGSDHRLTSRGSYLSGLSDLVKVQKDFGLQGIHFGRRGGGAHAAEECVELEDSLIVVKAIMLLAIDSCEVDEN